MTRTLTVGMTMPVAFLATASPALAVEAEVPEALWTGTGVFTLLVAVALLVQSLLLRRVAHGGAIAESVGFVVAAALALAASVLVTWVARFLPVWLSVAQADMAAGLLVAVAMVLLAVYFYRVRRALERFAQDADVALARMQSRSGEGASSGGGVDL